jgi:hypothetical protein
VLDKRWEISYLAERLAAYPDGLYFMESAGVRKALTHGGELTQHRSPTLHISTYPAEYTTVFLMLVPRDKRAQLRGYKLVSSEVAYTSILHARMTGKRNQYI